MNLGKLSLTKEMIFADAGRTVAAPIARAVAVAVIGNPFAGRFVDDPIWPVVAEVDEARLVGMECERRCCSPRAPSLARR